MNACLRAFPFHAARRLGPSAEDPKQARSHGRDFLLTLRADPGRGFGALAAAAAGPLDLLDHRDLNESLGLEDPSEAALAAWVLERCPEWVASATVGLTDRSAERVRGVDATRFRRALDLHAAHYLPHVPEGHKCGRLHGHLFRVTVQWSQQAGAPGAAAAGHLAARPLVDSLSDTLLNEAEGLENPTSERLASWFYGRLEGRLPGLERVMVHETAAAASTYDGREWESFKEFTLDSAVPNAKGGVTGRTILARLHVAGALDPRFGWTRDFGDIKELFAPHFKRLDHHPLHLPEVLGMEAMDARGLIKMAEWVYDRMRVDLPELRSLSLWDTGRSGIEWAPRADRPR